MPLHLAAGFLRQFAAEIAHPDARALARHGGRSCAALLAGLADAIRARHFAQLLAQQLPPAAQPAHHGSDRHVQHSGDFLVGELLHVRQQNRGPVIGRQAIQRAQNLRLRRCAPESGRRGGGLLQDFFAVLDPAQVEPLAAMVMNGVDQDLEQPGPAIGAGLEAAERFPGL